MEIADIKLEELELDNIGSWPLPLRILILLATALATFYLGYSMILSDRIDELSAVTQKKEQTKTIFFETQQKVTNLKAYKEEVKLVEEQLNKLTEQLPSSSEEAGVLEDISQATANYNLQFIAIKPGKIDDKGFYNESPLQLELAGNYTSFGEFTSKISTMKRIVTLHDFSIRKNDTKANGSLIMVVLAKTYWVNSEGIQHATP